MTPGDRPPRLALASLRWAARRLRTPDLPDDAADVFVMYVRSRGRRGAKRWYWSQVLAALWRVACSAMSVTGLSLDVRLGVRMLRRYPGLTLVGGLAMAFAIFLGSALFEFINQTLPGRDLPVPGGTQVVGLRLWDREASRPEPPTPQDVDHWARHLKTVELVGAFASTHYTIETETGATSQVSTALMSPSGFRIADVRPVAGRVFTEADLTGDNGLVAVIGASTWRVLFDRRADVIGRQVRIGGDPVTIIGVMPERFRFPVSHELWMPLDLRTSGATGLRGFGRLVGDATIEQAQAEVIALGQGPIRLSDRAALLPRVEWYRASLFDRPVSLLQRALIQQLNIFAVLFLLLVSANIGLLTFARAAARERELVVRSALGASRRRVVLQFLVEAVLLFGAATALGLAAAGPGLAWVERRIGEMGGGASPFWFSPTVSPETAIYAVVLALVAALMTGGVPALRATRQLNASRLQDATSGAGRLRLGGIWTAVIVTQVAATVVFTAGAALLWRQAHRSGSLDAAFRAAEYVALTVDAEAISGLPGGLARVEAVADAVGRTPGVAAVTVADRLPLMVHGGWHIELDSRERFDVSMPRIGRGFFDTFGARMISGRGFTDVDRQLATVIVDQSFADVAFEGRDPIGQRLRVVDPAGAEPPGPWLEIVGVVAALESGTGGSLYVGEPKRPFVYRPLESTAPTLVHIAAHMPSATPDAVARVRQVAANVDASLTVHDGQTLDQVVTADAAFWRWWAELVLMAGVVALVLALAGIYAVMSFTVTRRTREIGIRMALGARGGRVTLDVLRAPLRHVAGGLLIGCGIVVALYWSIAGGVTPVEIGLLVAFGACVSVVCLVACLGPARRALGVHPARSLGVSE